MQATAQSLQKNKKTAAINTAPTHIHHYGLFWFLSTLLMQLLSFPFSFKINFIKMKMQITSSVLTTVQKTFFVTNLH